MEHKDETQSFAPTEAMRNNARRGLALREKWHRGGLAISKAKEIIAGELSLADVKKMYSFFNTNEKQYLPKSKLSDGGPTEGTIAWLLSGGSAGQAWTRMHLKQAEIIKSYTKEITESELTTEDQLLGEKLSITKAVDEELKQATFIVMVPDEIDAHGDTTTEEEVRKACHNFNKYSMKANLFHLVETSTFEFCESYCCPTDFVLGDKFVKKGTWLATVQALDDNLWGLIKSGDINGLSIGALAAVEIIEEE
jgi:hypothetical protein